MKKYLSIGEISNLLGVEVYNIRYYEKEGLIKEPKKTEKGYRLYDMEDINQLSIIILLRKSNIPIKDIKELFSDFKSSDFNTTKYKQLMMQSSENLQEEIDKLIKIKREVDDVIQGFDSVKLGYSNRYIGPREVLLIKECSYDEDLEQRDVYEFLINNNVKVQDLYKIDICCMLDDNRQLYYMPYSHKPEGLKSTKITGGEYLCYTFLAKGDKEILKEVFKFVRYIKKNKIATRGLPILNEKSLDSLYMDAQKNPYEIHILRDTP